VAVRSLVVGVFVALGRPDRLSSAAPEERLYTGSSRRVEMTIMFARHRVADYEAWRRVYDSVGEMQREGGVTEEAVYRAEDDPNEVLVMHGSVAQMRPTLSWRTPTCAKR
jgi:hypothetical protein